MIFLLKGQRICFSKGSNTDPISRINFDLLNIGTGTARTRRRWSPPLETLAATCSVLQNEEHLYPDTCYR